MGENPTTKAVFEQARAEARIAERARCKAIVESPEAAFRYKQAIHIATQTDMTVEAARAHLDTLPADPQTNANNASTGFAATVAAARGAAPQSATAPAGLGASLSALGRRH